MRKMLLVILMAVPLSAQELTVLVDGAARAAYQHRGTTYIEAIRGRDYTLRITNPHPYRVAVALAVDGLNTIDAKHTDAWNASKWVLEPYETADIAGWQVSGDTARRFFFTGERNSYGAALNQTENLGVIEAIFYRERSRPITRFHNRDDERSGAAAGAPAPQSSREVDDYAATGMGDRTRHEVERVDIELEREPIARVRVRYEFRPQLVKLGVLDSRLERREKASGFCPQP